MKLPRVKNLLPDWGRYWNQIPFRARLMLLGFTLTVLVLVMEGIGALTPLENWLYDIRARHCQFYAKAPTTQLVHLDIDDAALETVGKWPWDRRFVAAIIDEIREAGAKVLALDIQFTDEDTQGGTQQSVAMAPATGPATTQAAAQGASVVDAEAQVAAAAARDAALAASVERFGKIVLAAGFTFNKAGESELQRVVREQLRADLEMTPEDLMAWLKKYGGPKLRDTDPDSIRERLVVARREVAREKLLAAPNLPASELLPRETRGGLIKTSPLLRLVESERQKARAILTMGKLFPREVPSDVPDLMVATGEQPPLEILTRAIWRGRQSGGAGMIGSVTASKDELSSDGVVRSVPLLINDRGHLLPQFGLALACMMLGVDPTSREELSVGPDQIVLAPPGGEHIIIPVFRHHRPGYPVVGADFLIPWFGGSDWIHMYDWPRGTSVPNHFPITWATTIVERRNYLKTNDSSLARAAADKISGLREMAGLKEADPAKPLSDVVTETLAAAKPQVDDIRKLPDSELDDGLRNILLAFDTLTLLNRNNIELKSEIQNAKEKLRKIVAGKAVIVGSTGSSSGADFFTTSLHPYCPGSVVHGVIFNAIMTRNLWSLAPNWIAYLIAICFGLIMTFAVSKLTPWGSTAVAILLVTSFSAVNGFWLFDRHSVVLNASAPLAAVILVWAGCTAANAGERFRIMQTLRGYIDPGLVTYLTEHSEKDLFRPRMAELTVVFTDLQGFTTLSQELGEKTAPLISRYMSVMVEVIRRRGGLVNKFLGDGIMFFFGAPMPDPLHPEHAVNTVLEMHQALAKFNQVIREEGLPELAMRCGVSTGNMVVGNAGPEDARDYTVLGDAVNLGARLEAANKACNTRVLVTERTYNLTRNSFLYIPVGKLKVRGRSEGSMTYEAVCRIEEATAEQKQLADAMQAMILAFTQGVFDGCMNMVAAIEKRFGEHHSCRLYRQLCHQYAEDGVPEGFHGEIFFG
ncbi:MAG: adenylate/guanylate cyclase with Chase sensor [Phycisphaerales bacterium]|nr:adenylate/guanylate cyclase with Chase sensor [Phycisphaerales bacterium]